MKKITWHASLVRKAMMFLSVTLLGLLPIMAFGQTEISTVQGLKDIANNLSGSYKLTADITLTDVWAPIGTDAAPFTGIIDGNGHIIKGLKTSDATIDKVGLIAVASAATIKKLGLELVDLQGHQDVAPFIGKSLASKVTECYSTGRVTGNDHVGGIIGGTYQSTPSVISEITNCYSTALIFSKTYQAGGILGTAGDVSVTNVFFSGAVVSSANCGGIVSLIDAASADLTEPNIIANTVVIASTIDGNPARRILGNAAGRVVTQTNNFAKTDILVNGIVVDEANDVDYGSGALQGESKTLAELKTVAFYTTTMAWTTDVWNLTEGSLPILKWQAIPSSVDQFIGFPTATVKCPVAETASVKIYSSFGETLTYASSKPEVATVDADGTIHALTSGTTVITVTTPGSTIVKALSGTFSITVISLTGDIVTADDLDNIRLNLTGVFTLQNDITLTSAWTPIADFKGTLNGNGHIIKGLAFNDPNINNVGLFASTSGAIISKLGIENANLIGNADVGGIVGNAKDATTISECYVANSRIEGRDHVGSIVGAARTVSVISNCYGTAEIFSRSYQAAGIAGILEGGAIDKCFFSGLVNNGSSNTAGMASLLDGGDASSNVISNCVTLSPYLLGANARRIFAQPNGNEYTLHNNYAGLNVKVGTTSVNLSGISTSDTEYGADLMQGADATLAEIKTKEFYKTTMTWDMENIWKMVGENEIYPVLAWQTVPFTPTILAVPSDVIIKKGVSVKQISYGSMGQALNYDSPELNTIVSVYRDYNAESELNFILWGTLQGEAGNDLVIGTATINTSSDATAYMNAASKTYSIQVVDPASLKKDINNATDLINIKDDLLKDYILRANIDLSSVANWLPIGTTAAPFKGSLDGNGYSISNLKSSRTSTNIVGLFGFAQDATFKNIALVNVNVVGSQDVGGLIGKATGVQISQSYVTGVVEGNDHAGAIIGGTSSGNISNITDCYSTADVKTRSSQVGGLLGVASSTNITNCYFAGTVTAPTGGWTNNAGGFIALVEDPSVQVTNSVSAASSVIGGTANPFITREDKTAIITSCLYRSDMTVSAAADATNTGSAQPDATIGRDLSTLKLQSTYTGLSWNFSTIWTILPDQFPTLKGVGTISAVESVKSTNNYKAYVLDSKLHLKGLTNATVSVYTVSGSVVEQVNAQENELAIKLPSQGIYLVRILEKGMVTVIKVINY
jgi:hypothetical protein